MEVSYQEESPAAVMPAPVSGTGEDEVYLLPVSFAQQRLWFLSRFQPTSPYNIFGALALTGPLRPDVLERSFAELIARHEILRTTFSMMTGEPVQVVAQRGAAAVPAIDLRALPAEFREAEVARIARAEAARPFDLTRGPLLRLRLFRTGERRHVLLYALHHIIADGWSEEILLRELATVYQAFCADRPSPLPELPLQYGDFANWQREWLQGEVLEGLVEHWKQQLAGAPGVLELPTDFPRPAVFSNRGASLRTTIPAEVANGLHALSQREGATLFMTLLAAFGVLLGRHAGQEDVLVGSPVANRDQVELEGLIGLFLNTLVLRVDMTGDPTFRELLGRVRERTYGAQENRDLPFERLIAALGLGRDQSRNPLFQVFFNLESAGRGGKVELPDLSLEPMGIGADTAKFDLLLNIQDGGRELAVSLEYCTDLFTAATVRRMLDHFEVLLAGIAADPEQRVAEIPLLTAPELRQVLADWNETRRDDFPAGACLHELLERRAQELGNELAVVCRGQRATFGELDRRSNQLGHSLRSLGVGPDVPVGVCLHASVDMVVAILGILKAGGAYLPIDPAYPAERIAFLIADARARVIVTHERHRPSLAASGAHLVCLDSEARAVSAAGSERVASGVAPENLAYVIYTSGSTGRPKGVMVPHRGVVNYLSWAVEAYEVARGNGAPVHSSIGFDLSVTSLFAPLLAGRPVTLLGEDFAAEGLIAALGEGQGFSFVKLTPAHLDLVNRSLAPDAAAASCRALVLGGETLLGRSLVLWREAAPATRLINEYGPTEAVVGCVVYEVPAGSLPPADVPIGRPIANSQAYVLGPRLQPVPVGVAGELYIGGIQVTRGYLDRPELTAERFVPDPFSPGPGQRLYRTGDLARYQSDGTIRLLGRADHQVKIHGFRIEPGEIEAVLAAHPGVAEAAVVAHQSEGEKRLVGYIVPRSGARPSLEELRQFLGQKLPEHMVPSAFVTLESMPLTSHGKVDRGALPAPGSERPVLEQAYVPPSTIVEDALASIWSAALGIDRIGVHDNFFTLGGDSILSIQVVALAKARGLDFALQDIFRFPTIAALAREIRVGEKSSEEEVHTEPFSLISAEDRLRLPDDVEDAYPLSGLQQGMLFHIEQMAGAPVFHSINSYYLRLPFDPNAFQRAVDHMAARHANLRTSFDLTSYSEPLQLVHRIPVFPVEVDDIRHLDREEQDRVLDEFWQRELVRPFALDEAPQLRFHVHWRSDTTFQFTLTENHAVIDGWSLHNLYDELLACYFAFLKGEPAPALMPLRTTFRDFIHLERQALESPETCVFWERKLDGCTVLKVPRSSTRRGIERGQRCVRFDIALPDELTAGLQRLAQKEAVPLKSVLLAAHLRVMSAISGQRDVVTGLSSNGRPETLDGQRIGGLFLNTLPARLDLAGGTWRELVRQAYELELEMVPHRRYPLSALQAKWGREALLETSFVYLNFHVMEDLVRSRRMEAVDRGTFIEETNFVIMTAFQHSFTSSALLFTPTYDRTALSDEQIDAFTEYYLATLRAMAGEAGDRYETFSPLSSDERRTLLLEWNPPPQDAPAQRPVHELFEEQAERNPERLCAVGGGEELTFGEVERRANRLANHLRALGVGPESRVGVCLDRSPDMVVGLLGVWKAGGAYVPMDPAFPPARLAHMIGDSGASAVVTLERWRDRLEGCGAEVLCLDSGAARIAAHGDGRPAGGAGLDNLAYVIYTSGSTGRSKGVAIEHRHLAGYVAAIVDRLELPAGASYGMVSTFAADLGNTVLFPPLCTGGTLHLVSEERAKDPVSLADELAARPVDCLKIVPSYLAALLDAPEPARLLPRRRLVLGGEAADWRLIERIRELAPECRILNHYGPTETTVGVLTQALDEERAPEGPAIPPLGRPLGAARVYLLDSHLQLAPPATPGELCIGGPTVARGYIGRPDLTAEKLIPDAWSGEPGARVYRSGDLARHLPDGALEFLGRIDQQAKIRGFRVEPGEVAVVLREHPAVREAAVVVRPEDGQAKLAAYVVAEQSPPVTDAELRAFLEQRLPAYMVPSVWVRMSGPLPRTANGKLDAARLPEPGRAAQPRDIAQPRDPVELQLVHLWEDLLGVHPVSVTESFFEIGGNSLLAIRLMARIRKQLGQSLPLGALLDAPTIRQLAEKLRADLQPEAPRHLVPVQPHGSRPPLYCVHPGHGSIYNYLRLARYLGADQPFYGLQALDLDREGDPYLSVEELATRYLAELREVQPHGPYLLAGWSFGGLVAFEMAQRLWRSGEEVAGLAFFDVRTPAANARLAGMNPELLQAFLVLEHAKMMTGASASDLPLSPRDLLGLDIDAQIDRVIREMKLESVLPKDLDLALLRRYFQLRLARFEAIKNYRPEVYPGRITLFRATDVYTDTALDEAAAIFAEAARNPTYGWDELSTQPIDLRPVPGDHESIVYEPNVQVLARELRKLLEEITERSAAA